MATRKAAGPVEGQENWGVTVPGTGNSEVTVPEGPDEDLQEAPTDRLARVLGSLDEDARASVRVYRLDPKTRAMAWCRNYTVQEFEERGDLEGIRQLWGPGEYVIRIYATQPGTNRYVVRNAVQLTIAPDPTAATAPVAQQNSEIAAVLQSMQQSNQAMFEQLARALGERPDPMAQMKSTIELFALMKAASGDAPKSQLGEIVGAIRELRSVAEEINPKPEPADDTGGLLPMAGQLMSMIANAQQAQQQQAQQVAQFPALPPVAMPPSLRQRASAPAAPPMVPLPVIDPQSPVPTTAPAPLLDHPTPAPELTPEDAAMFAELNALFTAALAMASDGKPAEEGAELLYEKLPDPILDVVFSDQWYEALVQVAPQCAQHEAWIREVRAIMLEFAEEDAKETTGEAGSESTGPSSAPIASA
jgi:hypothetical protein